MATDERPEQSWDPAVLARMRAIAQAPKPEADAAGAKRTRRQKRKPKAAK